MPLGFSPLRSDRVTPERRIQVIFLISAAPLLWRTKSSTDHLKEYVLEQALSDSKISHMVKLLKNCRVLKEYENEWTEHPPYSVLLYSIKRGPDEDTRI